MSIVTLRDEWVTARKQHTCSYFPYEGHTIEPGDRYRVSAHIYDGQRYTWKACKFHNIIADSIFRRYGCGWSGDGVDEEDVVNELREIWRDAEYHADRGLPFSNPIEGE